MIAFDEHGAESLAPILGMIGRQASVDPASAWQLTERVAGEVLPELYRQARDSGGSGADRIALGLRLAFCPGARTGDLVQLAQAYSDADRLEDALYWIRKAREAEPGEGEHFRFEASILERMQMFDAALDAALNAQRLGAEPHAIRSDIDRIRHRRLSHLKESAASGDLRTSLQAYLALLQLGQVSSTEFVLVLLRTVQLFVRGTKGRSRRNQPSEAEW